MISRARCLCFKQNMGHNYGLVDWKIEKYHVQFCYFYTSEKKSFIYSAQEDSSYMYIPILSLIKKI